MAATAVEATGTAAEAATDAEATGTAAAVAAAAIMVFAKPFVHYL